METTIEDRLIIAAIETEGMPFPQRVLRSGLKRVTIPQLYERFACRAIEDAQNEIVLKTTIPNLQITGASNLEKSRMRIEIESGSAPDRPEEIYKNAVILHKWLAGEVLIWDDGSFGEPIEQDTEYRTDGKRVSWGEQCCIPLYECAVETKPISEYSDEIPDRVLRSYMAAVSLGFTEFSVAFPVVREYRTIGDVMSDFRARENKRRAEAFFIEEQQRKKREAVQQSDPVLMGKCADFWFEIDYWE